MDGFIEQFYGIHVAGDLGGAVFVLTGWVICGAHLFPQRWAPWLWLTLNLALSTVSSLPIVLVACVRGDVPVALYHAMWVLAGIPATVWCFARLRGTVAPRLAAWRERREITNAHRRIVEDFYAHGDTVDGEVISRRDET